MGVGFMGLLLRVVLGLRLGWFMRLGLLLGWGVEGLGLKKKVWVFFGLLFVLLQFSYCYVLWRFC